MKKNILIPVLLLCLFIVSCNKDDNQNIVTDNTGSRLQAVTENLYNKYITSHPGYPGSLILKVTSPKGSWFYVAGDKSITSSHHFRCASNTKSFTSSSIVLLAQQGKLNLNAKIIDTIPGTNMTYVPLIAEFMIPHYRDITIKQLMQHRAGVFDVSNDAIPDTVTVDVPYKGQNYCEYVQGTEPRHTYSFRELVGVASKCRLFYFVPGTGYHYSNTGYSILGEIIERVSGVSYQQFVTTNLIDYMKLGSTSSPVSGLDSTLPAPYASGYIYFGNSNQDVTISNISANVAEGNIITTADDLSKYLRTLLRGEGPISSYYVWHYLLMPMDGSQLNWYACGLEYISDLGYGHNGAHEGYLSRMIYDPDADFTVVAYTNAWDGTNGLPGIGNQFALLLDEACYEAKRIVVP